MYDKDTTLQPKQESGDKMTKIRRKITSIVIILLGLLITTPTIFAQSPNNDPGRRQRERTTWQQNMPIRQHPAIRVRRLARQNWILRLRNRIQMRRIRHLCRQCQKQHRALQQCHGNHNPRGNQMSRP